MADTIVQKAVMVLVMQRCGGSAVEILQTIVGIALAIAVIYMALKIVVSFFGLLEVPREVESIKARLDEIQTELLVIRRSLASRESDKEEQSEQ